VRGCFEKAEKAEKAERLKMTDPRSFIAFED
jgi:hypothetical protein